MSVHIPLPDEDEPRMNLSPLIDVVFILLVFVVLIARFIDLKHVDVDVPDSSAGQKDSKEALIVSIPISGIPVVADVEVPVAEMRSLLARMRDQHDRVIIVADKDVKLDVVVQVLTAARLESYENVAIATEDEEPDGKKPEGVAG